MEFKDIFQEFLDSRNQLKTVFIGSCDENGQPNCSPKMLVDVERPNKVFYVDFKNSRTYLNIEQNWQSSLAMMDDKTFTGYRLSGFSQIIDSGREYLAVKDRWAQKIVSYEAERMIERIKGIFSPRVDLVSFPEDFVIIKFVAEEAAIVRPDRILRTIRKMRRGESGEKPISHPIKKIVQLESQLTEHIMTEKRLEARERELERASVEDELTGLYNRRGFVTLVKQQLKQAKRNGRESFLIFSDLDRLKPINDTYGHRAGDKALTDAAQILKKTFRESDIVARIGGDEFAIALIDCEKKDLDAVTNRLRSNIEMHNQQNKMPYFLDLSVGIASCRPDESVALEELLSRADRMMYEEKKKKKAVSETA